METTHQAALHRLKAIVAGRGVRAGIEYLNGLSAHRFTAMYRFDQDMLRNRVFFDRENPEVTGVDDIPVLASYCVFVRDTASTWGTAHAALDDRVGDHAKRHVLQAYCGVPLRDGFGHIFGTLCHFDFAPTPTSPAHIDLMESAAPILQHAAD